MKYKTKIPRPAKRKPKASERIDIRGVARLAKVSPATVSRAMNGVPSVDSKIAKRVWKVVHDSGYLPNTQARALVSGRSKTLGIIISDLTNPFFPELIKGFEDVAVEHGYEIMVGSTYYDKNRMSRCIRRMIERNVDGVAVMTFGLEEPLIEQLAERQIPLVFIDMGLKSSGASVLKVDYHQGIRQGVQHLAALGNRNIAFVSGPRELRSAMLRQAAFSRSLQECGIKNKSAWMMEGNHTVEGGMEAMERLLALGDLPTAVMCSNDMTAIGLLHTLYRVGLRVPEDISIVGFDDIHIARLTIPPLTTVVMSRIEVARAAVAALRSELDGNPGIENSTKN